MPVRISDTEMCGIFIYFDLFEDPLSSSRLCSSIYYVRPLFSRKQKSLATISNLISCICYLYLPGEVFCTQDLYKFYMIQGIHKNDILLLLFFKMALALFLFLVLLKSMFLNETCVLIILINQKKVKNV